MEKMYSRLAAWWPLISPVEDYADEFAFFKPLLAPAALRPDSTLLELGSGGGNNAFYFKTLFAHVTLTDLSPDMLAVSRALNPGCEHLQGDMRTLRLGRTFDAVFVHDAVDYMTTPEDLQRAITTVAVHCKPGGLALLVPDHVRETFEASTEQGGTDDTADGNKRALRYLEWTYDPDESDTICTTDYVYLLREGDRPVTVEHDQHLFGLFSRDVWLQCLRDAGLQAEIIRDPFGRDVFLARRV
jgi:SAM-dependent methyltransferase